MASNDTIETSPGWLPADTIESIRGQIPIVYVEAVPVRLDHLGRVTHVGLLLRARPDGSISRAVVSGRVLLGETVREALWRHLAKDLGADAEPLIPAAPAPFTVAEYFPDADRTGFHDPRQHAVALCYVVPIDGDCTPAQDTLEFRWLTVPEALSAEVAAEMSGGHDRLVRLAAAHVQRLL